MYVNSEDTYTLSRFNCHVRGIVVGVTVPA